VTDRGLLLLGSTDLTRAVADALVESRVRLDGVVSAPAEFNISYSAEPVRNSRHVDLARWCEERGVPFRVYSTPDDIAHAARQTGATAALLAGWYHMVPERVRRLFPCGCIGLHASLLPRYRGGAPLNWALLNGDAEAGVSLFELTDGVDEGMLYDQRRFAIHPDDYIADVVQKAEAVTVAMVCEDIPAFLAGGLTKQPQAGVPSYALQRQPADAMIDWQQPACDIVRLVRSVSRPYPGARTALEGTPLTIWRARLLPEAPLVYGVPGQIVRLPELAAPGVVTGAGLVAVEEVEGPGAFDLDAFAACHQRRLDRGAR
jgi:methionyl-tRNA formyltransferase